MDDPEKLHIVMFPWLAFGHVLPYLELSKLMAQEGHRISFISTPRNIDRLPELPPDLRPRIDLVKFPVPKVDGLPENAEATTDLPGEKLPSLKKAFDDLHQPMTRFLETSHPDWIIYDFALTGCRLSLLSIGFHGRSCLYSMQRRCVSVDQPPS